MSSQTFTCVRLTNSRHMPLTVSTYVPLSLYFMDVPFIWVQATRLWSFSQFPLVNQTGQELSRHAGIHFWHPGSAVRCESQGPKQDFPGGGKERRTMSQILPEPTWTDVRGVGGGNVAMKVVKCWSMSCPTEIMTSDSAKKIMTTFVFFFGTIHTSWKLLGRKKRKKKKNWF